VATAFITETPLRLISTLVPADTWDPQGVVLVLQKTVAEALPPQSAMAKIVK
jgi:hypothetical protein